MMCKHALILVFCIIMQGFGFGQSEEAEWFIGNMEELSEQEAERLDELINTDIQPVNLNQASFDQLMQIPDITPEMASAILAFRDTVGIFLSVYELMSVPGMEKNHLHRIAPWLNFMPVPIKKLTQTISLRYSLKKAISPETVSNSLTALGPPWKGVFRYKAEHPVWVAGIKAEKDAGEPFGAPFRPEGFDFYSGYAGYKGKGFIRQVWLGDYRISMGNGLLCSQSFSAGNDASLLYHPHDQRIIKPHTSLDEYLFFRGAAIRMQYGNFTLAIFGSAKKADGNITGTDSIPGKTITVSSIQKTGLHSTSSELDDRHALTEYAAGGSIRFRHRHLMTGVNTLYLRYDAAVQPAETFLNRNKFQGNKITGISLDGAWYNRWAGLAGELALTGKQTAMNQVLVMKASDNISVFFSTRWYDPAYQAPYASSIGRGTSPTGEKGINWVVVFTPKYGSAVRAGSDLYQIMSTAAAPVTGRKGRMLSLETAGSGLQLQYLLRVSCETYQELQTGSAASGENDSPFSTRNAFAVRGEIVVPGGTAMKWKYRVDYRYKDHLPGAQSWQMFAEANYRTSRPKLRIVLRQVLFCIDDYDLRVYSREHDALWAYSMSMHYGTGSRTYLFIQSSFRQMVHVWIKGGYTSYYKPGPDQTAIHTWDLSMQINISI